MLPGIIKEKIADLKRVAKNNGYDISVDYHDCDEDTEITITLKQFKKKEYRGAYT